MVRPNELSFARRGAILKLRARQMGGPGYLTARFIEIDPEDEDRAIVSFAGSRVSVPAGPQHLVPNTLVRVAVDSNNSPTVLLGAATAWPEGLDTTAVAPRHVTTMRVLAPETLTLEQIQELQSQVGLVQDTLTNLATSLVPEQELEADGPDDFEEI